MGWLIFILIVPLFIWIGCLVDNQDDENDSDDRNYWEW